MIPTGMKNACYLTLDTTIIIATSQKLAKTNDKLVHMTQPSAKLLAHVALRTDLSMSKL